MKKSILVLPVLAVIVMMTGCAGISLDNSWKDPGASTKKYRKLLIVGVSDKLQMRQVFEEVFAGEVRKNGVTAVASYTVAGSEEKLSRASLEEAVRKTGADGVVTTRLVRLKRDTDTRTGFVMTDRGYTNTSFNDPGIVPAELYGYYGAAVSYASFEHKSVDVTMSTVATIETNLFDAGTTRLVWSGTTSAVKPEGLITVSSELAQVVIRNMVKEGLI